MNEIERKALVDELAEAMAPIIRMVVDDYNTDPKHSEVMYLAVTEELANACLPVIDRLLATAPEPGLDELLDSVHPKATIDTLIPYDDGTWAVTIVHPIKPAGSYGQSLTSEILAYNATGPTRDEALCNAVAQATTTRERGEG